MPREAYKFVSVNYAILREIHSFKELPEGWHYGEGNPATQHAISMVVRVYVAFVLKGITRIEVFPGIDGGILLSGYHEEETIEVLCGARGEINLLHEVRNEVVHDEDYASADELDEYVRELPWDLRKSSDLFTRDTLVGRSEGLQVWDSANRQTEGAFQRWMQVVPGRRAVLNADISGSITGLNYPENRQYFCGSVLKNYQTVRNSGKNHPVPMIFAT